MKEGMGMLLLFLLWGCKGLSPVAELKLVTSSKLAELMTRESSLERRGLPCMYTDVYYIHIYFYYVCYILMYYALLHVYALPYIHIILIH